MTTDSLLALAISVFIPTLLSLGGGLLAIRTLDRTKQHERSFWLTFFSVLTLLAIAFGFVQQVRNTDQQKAATESSTLRQQVLEGNQRYTQGQLDSINKVLTVAVSSPNLTPAYTATLNGLLAASRDAAHKTPEGGSNKLPTQLSNDELYTQAIELSSALKSIGGAYQTVISNYQFDASVGRKPDVEPLVSLREAQHQAMVAWSSLRSDYSIIDDEVIRRTTKHNDHMKEEDAMTEARIDNPNLIESGPYFDLANNLQERATLLKLPKRKN